MCGLAGVVDWSRTTHRSTVQAMTDKLAHRGPDAEAVSIFGNATFGHRRLRILDLSESADQPMRDEQRGIVLIFNGEIYNYRSLRKTLQEAGEHFHTSGDTEVLLRAFARWGIDCVGRLVGMFAFAVWDEKAQRLYLVRDRLGKKPLYYSNHEDAVVFASELGALRAFPGLRSELSPVALSHFLSLGYTLSGSCILKGLHKVPPGHAVVFDRGRAGRFIKYWDLARFFREKTECKDIETAADQLASLFDDAVACRMSSDVPLGAFLSSGIDSACVVEAMSRAVSVDQIHTYTMGFSISGFDERAGATATAHALGVGNSSRQLSNDLADHVSRVIAAYDEPFADTSMLPSYLLCGFAREHVTVCLTGDGGDENFAGYPTYMADKLHGVTGFVPDWMTRIAGWAFDKVAPVSSHPTNWDQLVRRYLQSNAMPDMRAHAAWRQLFTKRQVTELLDSEIERTPGADPLDVAEDFAADVSGADLLDQAIYVDIKTWLVDDILVKVDRASMAHSLELRSPLLDHRIVEFAASLPSRFKLNGLSRKVLLKHLAARRLPKDVLSRPKCGFNAPISDWLSGELRDFGRDVTLGPRLGGYVRRDVVESLWDDHLARRRDQGLALFALLSLGLWLENNARPTLPATAEAGRGATLSASQL